MRIKFLPLLDWLFMPKKLSIIPTVLDLFGLGGEDPPPAPDYMALAGQTAEDNLKFAGYNTDVNRPDMYNPYGSSTWAQGADTIDQAGFDQAMADYNTSPASPSTGNVNNVNNDMDFESSFGNYSGTYDPASTTAATNPLAKPDIADYTTKSNDWTNTVTFSPDQQALFDQQNKNQQLQGDLAGQGLSATGDMFSNPFDSAQSGERSSYIPPTGQMPTYGGVGGAIPNYQGPTGNMPVYGGPQDEMEGYGANRQKVQDAMLSRVDADIARDKEAEISKLRASGMPAGSKPYMRELELINRKHNDARDQVEINTTQMANMDYNRILAGRQQGVSELKDLYTSGMQNRNQGIGEQKDVYNAGMQSRNQGIGEAKDMFNYGMDTRNQGINESKDAFNFGNQTMDNRLRDALLSRQTPLNEYNSLMTGTQVSNPMFNDFAKQQQILGPDYSGAGNQQSQYDLAGWNADAAQNNAVLSGLFGLGAAKIKG